MRLVSNADGLLRVALGLVDGSGVIDGPGVSVIQLVRLSIRDWWLEDLLSKRRPAGRLADELCEDIL